MLPIADSSRRVGSRLMSNCWVPMTWLRRTAVLALASSTIALTSARRATPMFLATRVAPPAQSTSPPLDHQLEHRVARAGVEALETGNLAVLEVGDAVGVAHEHRVDGGVLELVRDRRGSARPRHAGARCRSGCLPLAVPWWITTTWTLTPSVASRFDSALIAGPSSRNVSPAVAPARDELGRLLELGADDADLDAVDAEDLRPPSTQLGMSAGRVVDDVGREEREVAPARWCALSRPMP